MARPRRRRRSARGSDSGRLALGVILGVVAIGGLSALIYVWATIEEPPVLDQTTMCPVDGPRAITVVLLDIAAPLPDSTRIHARRMLEDDAAAVPRHGLLEIRQLDLDVPGGRIVFSRCNPGDGEGVSELTGNPTLALRRWEEGYRAPLDALIEEGIAVEDAPETPLMEAIQAIALERFAGKGATGVPKRLVIASDMLQHGADHTHYAGQPSFQAFRGSLAHRRIRPDLAGADVYVRYIERQIRRPIDTGEHIRFWAEFFADGNGRLREAVKLQGVGW